MNKANRIHHAKRIKRKVAGYWNVGVKSPRNIGITARTPQRCSCECCGNQGRHEGDKVKYKALLQRRLIEGWNG